MSLCIDSGFYFFRIISGLAECVYLEDNWANRQVPVLQVHMIGRVLVPPACLDRDNFGKRLESQQTIHRYACQGRFTIFHDRPCFRCVLVCPLLYRNSNPYSPGPDHHSPWNGPVVWPNRAITQPTKYIVPGLAWTIRRRQQLDSYLRPMTVLIYILLVHNETFTFPSSATC